ncbi:Protein of unknown function [Gryllus bimaculatus]|nr:Protein of unknown function [Gryllus bimaculatus]
MFVIVANNKVVEATLKKFNFKKKTYTKLAEISAPTVQCVYQSKNIDTTKPVLIDLSDKAHLWLLSKNLSAEKKNRVMQGRATFP